MVFTFATMEIRDFVVGSRKVTGEYGTDNANLGLLFDQVSMSGTPQNISHGFFHPARSFLPRVKSIPAISFKYC